MKRIKDTGKKEHLRRKSRRNTKNYKIEKRRRKLIRRQKRQEKRENANWRGRLQGMLAFLPRVGKWALKILLVCLLAYVYVACFGQKVSTIGDSMNPTLENGDVVLVNRIAYLAHSPKRGDVIVFRPHGDEQTHYYIKRIIGMPGETVEIMDNKIFIDGEELDASYVPDEITDPGLAAKELKLGDDEYFVLGDDCQNSEDSRDAGIGNVKNSYIYGKAWFIASPHKRRGFIKNGE